MTFTDAQVHSPISLALYHSVQFAPANTTAHCHTITKTRTDIHHAYYYPNRQSPISNSLPILDTHVHYSRNSWSEYAPQEILDKLIGANVARALVSSSPDEGTRRLYELDPVRIVLGLRPYHDDVTSSNWETNNKTLPYIQARIDSPVYAAFGEIHVHLDNIESPIFQDAVERALARDLILHIHSDAATVRAVMAKYPNAKILWAHAGLIETPQTVSQVLDEFPNVWTDISIREHSIAPNGTLSDEWRALFLKHPTRITIARGHAQRSTDKERDHMRRQRHVDSRTLDKLRKHYRTRPRVVESTAA